MYVYTYIYIRIYVKEPYRAIGNEMGFCRAGRSEPHITSKEPCISAKEPCISAKEPYIYVKEPYRGIGNEMGFYRAGRFSQTGKYSQKATCSSVYHRKRL